MTRAHFRRLVAEALDSLPPEFLSRMDNVAVLVEDLPAEQRRRTRTPPPRASRPRELLMGVFLGTPTTNRSVFAVPGGPCRIILFQKNIESVCHTDAEIRREVRLTIIHEVGHYFGMDEDQLRHV